MKRLFKLLFRIVLLAAALGTAFVIGMRAKYPPVQNLLRRMNKDVLNPEAMKTAGQPGASTSIIRHTGRKSGATYETPVSALDADDGFVIPLPYGTSSDWLKNVMASGTADIVIRGTTYGIDHPELIPASVAEPFVPADEQKLYRFFGVDDFLRVHKLASASEETDAPA